MDKQATKSFRKALAPLMKPVEKVFLADLIPGMTSNPQQECAIVIDDNGVKKMVNVCSKQYELLPNIHIIEPLLEMFGEQNITLQSSHRLDSRFSLDIVFHDYKAEIQGKDPIVAKLKMNNSYDGRAKYSFNMGFFRMICSNGMVIPLEGYEDKNISKKMRHTPALGVAFDKEALADMVQEFGENMLLFEKPFEDLASKKISQNDLPELLTTITGKTKFPVRQLDMVIDRLEVEMGLLKETTVNHWLVYNAFNYELNHSTEINLDPAKKEELDQSIFGLLLK